jgi:citrate synthase
MSPDPAWRTSISSVKPNEIRVRGYDLVEMIGRRSFGDVVYLLLSGELPEGNEGRMVEACLVAASEHSVVAPSVNAARFVASAGVPLQAAVAAGVAGLGDQHGGAVDGCARLLLDAAESDVGRVARRVKEEGGRLPGFGHVVHDPDPRAGRLLEVASELGFRGRWCALAEGLQGVTREVFGKHLHMNVDGALAAILLELGLDWRLGKAFYVIARPPGFVAHVHEEQTRERPYRDVGWENVEYDGPEDRPLP